ncbi:TPA: ead/Ea22-like family protein [Enterobacter hormaechei]
MSNIDKRALREAAEKATKGQWAVEFDDEVYSTDGVNNEQIAMVFSENEVRDAAFIAAANPATVLALLDELEAAEKRIAELEALGRGVKQFSEFQICHYGATEDYAKGYIDCQNNYNKVLFAAAGKGE